MAVINTVNDLPFGFAGNISRNINETSVLMGVIGGDLQYGRFVRRDTTAEKFVAVAATADKAVGVTVRDFTQGRDAFSELPPSEGTIGVAVRGFIICEVVAGESASPKAGDPVYLAADGCVAVTKGSLTAVAGAYFTGEVADGVAEIALNL